MFEVKNANKELIDGIISGKKSKELKKWNRIYNILKLLGIIASGVALNILGVTTQFAIISSSIFVLLYGIRENKVIPAKKAKELEDRQKQELMLEIQSKISTKIIDGKSFKLERTAKIDYRQPKSIEQKYRNNQGTIIKEDKVYGKVGTIETYIRGTDDKNGLICWLKLIRESIEEQRMFANGGGYETKIVPVYNVGMLESEEVENIPEDVKIQTAKYDGEKKKNRRR